MTFGFDSAVAEVMDALDRFHTTATSHKRVMVVEVMGDMSDGSRFTAELPAAQTLS